MIEGVLPLVVLGQAQQVASLQGHQLIGPSTADVHIAPDRPARLRRTREDATGSITNSICCKTTGIFKQDSYEMRKTSHYLPFLLHRTLSIFMQVESSGDGNK